MPGGDRTGPLGERSMTGRGFGRCGDSEAPGTGYMRPFPGRGVGFRRGRGRRMRRRMGFGQRWEAPVDLYPSPYSPENEAEMLCQQAKQLEDSLEQINKRLTQIEEQAQKDKNQKK